MKSLFFVTLIVFVYLTASDAFARDRDRPGRGRVVVGGQRPAVRVYTSHHRAPAFYSTPRYSRPSYGYYRSYRQPSYRPSYYCSYAPAPRYYSPPRYHHYRSYRGVSRVSVGFGFSYYRSYPPTYLPSYPPVVVVPAPAAPIAYAAPSYGYAVGDYRVGQYVGGGDYEFKFVGPDGRIYEAEVDDGIIEEIELD